MSQPHHYTLIAAIRLASGKLARDERQFTREQQDEAWREWRALREAPSTAGVILRDPDGRMLAGWLRPAEVTH
jgi:hypothetical protein